MYELADRALAVGNSLFTSRSPLGPHLTPPIRLLRIWHFFAEQV